MFLVISGYERLISLGKGIASILVISGLTFVVYYTFNLYNSLLNRFSLAFQENPDSFKGFNIVKIIYYTFVFLLLSGIVFGCYKSFIKYQLMPLRYQTFLVLSLYVFVMFILTSFDGFLLSFETGLIKELLIVTFMNFYVISLQIFWRVLDRPDDRLFTTQENVEDQQFQDIKSYNFFDGKQKFEDD